MYTMHIDVRIPWEPDKRLGYACNRMMETVDDWALILDWDVTLLNLNWYSICLNAIGRVGYNAGLISCLTNRIGCPLQKAPYYAGDDIREHMKVSERIEKENAGIIEDVTGSNHKLSGMFFLTRRGVWDIVGGVPDDKFIGMDNYYHDRVKGAGFRIYVMKDLYVYHRYLRQWK